MEQQYSDTGQSKQAIDPAHDTETSSVGSVVVGGVELPSPDPQLLRAIIPGQTDKFGYMFDPALHQTNENGGPKIVKRTKLIAIRQGIIHPATGLAKQAPPVESQNSTVPDSQAPKPDAPKTEQPKPVDPAQCKLAAQVFAAQFFAANTMLLGPDFSPVVDDASHINERESLAQALEVYFLAKGIVDVPPGIALALCVGSYYGSRIAAPTVRETVKQSLGARMYRSVKGWIFDRHSAALKRKSVGEVLPAHPRNER